MTDMAENQELRAHDGAPGAALTAARTAQNLSVADVARQLKLSVAQVTALEAGEFDRLPGRVFVRGFVRNYARLLKLDAEPILDSITPRPSEQEVRDEVPPSREIPFPSPPVRRWPRYAAAGLLGLAGLAGYEFYWSEPVTYTVTKPVAPPAASVAATEQASGGILPATANESSAPNAAQPEAGAAPAQPAHETRGASSAGAQPPAAGPEPGGGELRFAFDVDSWVQVRERSSGETIFVRLNPRGTEQRVSGEPPFMLVIGNARGVRLTYNDRPVDLTPHIVKDDVARFTLE